MRSLELISGGFNADDKSLIANISPTALALNLYVKSQGYDSDPALYWQENTITQAEKAREEFEKQKIEAEIRQQEMLTKNQK